LRKNRDRERTEESRGRNQNLFLGKEKRTQTEVYQKEEEERGGKKKRTTKEERTRRFRQSTCGKVEEHLSRKLHTTAMKKL